MEELGSFAFLRRHSWCKHCRLMLPLRWACSYSCGEPSAQLWSEENGNAMRTSTLGKAIVKALSTGFDVSMVSDGRVRDASQTLRLEPVLIEGQLSPRALGMPPAQL